jgi:hypothetical protein
MKSPSPSTRYQPAVDLHQFHSPHQIHLSPNYSSSTSTIISPKPKSSALRGFQSVFQRKPPNSLSSNSLRSAYSVANSTAAPDNHSPHPYATMPPAPVPVVSAHEHIDDEQECPVCLEPLSFSFRLPGEKPHVVPECGHSLHEVSPFSFPSRPCLRSMSSYSNPSSTRPLPSPI